MARAVNKVTTMRARIVALLNGINGSPNYWYSNPSVATGIPTGFQADETLRLFVGRGTSVRDATTKTAGQPFSVFADIDFIVVGQILASDAYLACEQMEQDILTALRADVGLSCDATTSLDAAVSYEASEMDVTQGIKTAAKTTVVFSVTYKVAQ